MYQDNLLWIGKSDDKVCMIPKMANRHGLIAGATGTGKTITLKVLAESFSDCGVPVFLTDVKGDLAGMCQPGIDSENMQKRITKFGLEKFKYQAYPTCFWDVFGENGHPIRATVSEMGPMLLARLMDLNQTQTDILSIVFKIADDEKYLILDLKDLRAMLQYVGDHTSDFTTKYGNITKQSVGAIARGLITLEEQGGTNFFGEPALDIRDWMRCDENGRGYINVLHCVKLINSPSLYATFLLWMLSELFEILPEAGDALKPKMVFFFDEAHLLFSDAPKALLEKVEQVVKLIRSKGIGIYFITQSPSDVPDGVLAQLGNRVQHALRAYTPSDQKAVKAAAQSFRENPVFSTEETITQMGIGEALISFLDEEGRPDMVRRSFVLPPQSLMGPITDVQRQEVLAASSLNTKYRETLDRESAFELLNARHAEEEKKVEEEEKAKEEAKEKAEEEKQAEKAKKEAKKEEQEKLREERAAAAHRKQSPLEKATTSAMNTIGREVGRSLIRGIMGNLFKRR